MKEMLLMQRRFTNRRGARALRLLQHRQFRAAYDFLLLRAECGDADPELSTLVGGGADPVCGGTTKRLCDQSPPLIAPPSTSPGNRGKRSRRPETPGEFSASADE